MVAIAQDAEPIVIRPQPGPQMAFLASEADIVVYGGAAGGGKSFGLLVDPLRNVHLPGFRGAIFRSTTTAITDPGALWDESSGIYPHVGGDPRIGTLDWRFPSGARIGFRHCEHEKDKYRYQGSQFAYLGFDEVTHFSETQFWYLLSRNRSTCGVRPYIRCTCNPDAGSWVAALVAWWIDQETGYPIPERSGVIRWFLRIAGVLHWADTREACVAIGREHGLEGEDCLPQSFTFIPAALSDNPELTGKDPGYRGRILAMPPVEQERLLRGNWKIQEIEGAIWPAEYFSGDIWFDEWPDDDEIRWKVLSLDPAECRTRKSDFAAYVMLALAKDGFIYVDADIARRDPRKTVRAGLEHYRLFGPHAWAIEKNNFLGLKGHIQDVADGIAPTIAPVTQSQNKIDRINLGLTGPLEDQQFRFRRNSVGVAELILQMRHFPLTGFHDDAPDALNTGLHVLRQLDRNDTRHTKKTERVTT